MRAFAAVGLILYRQAEGSKVIDVDGNSYIDYVCSWGPLILGMPIPRSCHRRSSPEGTSYGAPCRQEVEMASMICEAFPSIGGTHGQFS